MKSMQEAIDSNYGIVSDFLLSDIEKIYLVIGRQESHVRLFMDHTLLRASQEPRCLVYRYEIWEGENSRHFLYRWLEETASGKALVGSSHGANFLYQDPSLTGPIRLLAEKDIRPLEIRFIEAVRFISKKLSEDQRLVLAVVPRAPMSDSLLADFFKAFLRVLPVRIKIFLGQDENDVLVKQADFSPSNRLILTDLPEDDIQKMSDRYAACLSSGGVGSRLIPLMSHLVHPVSISLMSLVTGESPDTLKSALASSDMESLVEEYGQDHFRLKFQRLSLSSQKPAEDPASADKSIVEYFEKSLLEEGRGYPEMLYHSLGLLRLDDPDFVGNQTLSTCRVKQELGGADICEYELARALVLAGQDREDLRTRLLLALGEIQESRNRSQEAMETLNLAIESLKKRHDTAGLQKALELKSRAAFGIRETETARLSMEEALDLAREMGKPEMEADTLSQLGYIHFSTRQLDKAEALYRQSMDIYRRLAELDSDAGRRGEAAQLSNLGHTFYANGDFDSSETYHRKALDLYCALQDRKAEANQWGYIGHTFFAAKKFEKANEAFEKAAEIEEKMGEHQKAAQRHANVGHSMYAQRKVDLAGRSFEKALDKYREMGDRDGEAAQLSNLGIIKGDLGEFDQAIEYFGQSALIYAEINDPVGEASQIGKQGHVRRAQKRYEDAAVYYNDAIGRYKTMNYPMGEGNTEMDLGQLYMEKKEWDNAIDAFLRAKDVFAKIGHHEKESLCFVLTGQSEQARGRWEDALDAYGKAVDFYKKADNDLGVANVKSQMGLLQYERKNFGEAERLYLDALQVFREKEDKEGEANLLSNLGTLYFQSNDLEAAGRHFQQSLTLLRNMGHPLGVAGLLQNLSYVYEKEEKYAEAHECLTEAGELFGQLGMTKEAEDVSRRLVRLDETAGRSIDAMRAELFPGLSGDGKPVKKKGSRIGRNDSCPCGSGKKYKKCCGA